MNDPTYACPSLLELEELKLGVHADEGDQELARHVAGCPRCRALLTAIGDPAAPAELKPAPGAPHAGPAAGAKRAAAEAVGLRAGALWRAAPHADADFAWVVALIGRSPDVLDALLVAPVSPSPGLATSTDLLLDAPVLGYPAFLDMTNLGSVLRDQLLEPVAQLEREQAQAMLDLYRHLLGAAPAPAGAAVGAPAEDEADPRLLEQAARAEALQELWRPAHLLVQDEEAGAQLADAPRADLAWTESTVGSTALLSALLAEHLQGAEAEWDRATLLETSGADGAHLDGFLADRLQLTDKGDVGDLAQVLHVLRVPWEQAERAAQGSLARSAGGERRAVSPPARMAARSRAGADPRQTAKDLYADQSQVDKSDAARAREISAYLAELRRALEELD